MSEDVLARTRAAFKELEAQIQGLSDDELNAFRVDNWPRHEHWCGEDGTIRGLLWHVTAWKDAFGRTIAGGADVDPHTLKPASSDAAGMADWLRSSHQVMIKALEPYLPGANGGSPTAWPGYHGMDLPTALAIWSGHDQWHAAQIAHLRQRFLATRPASA
jgi:uncharacterized damage-inducible protein DinB